MAQDIFAPPPSIIEQLQAETRRQTAMIPPGKSKVAMVAVEWAGGVPYRFRFATAVRKGEHFELGADALTKFTKASSSASIHAMWSW